jgi:hypothetical protein
MNLKKAIYNLFFKKKKKTAKKKNSTRNSSEGKTGTSKTIQPDIIVKEGKYDTSFLRTQVAETEYISNLRVGRSWVLPQLVKMGFKGRGRSYKFDIEHFTDNLLMKYNASVAGRREVWNLLKRNYKAISSSNGTDKRSRWWTSELLKEMMEWDFGIVEKRSRGLNRRLCIEYIDKQKDIDNIQELGKIVKGYDLARMRRREELMVAPLPSCFIDAYMGDGAYNAMMTMVKVLGIRIAGVNGQLLSREECINEIEKQASTKTGRELLEYCKKVFFDSGAFDYKKYC